MFSSFTNNWVLNIANINITGIIYYYCDYYLTLFQLYMNIQFILSKFRYLANIHPINLFIINPNTITKTSAIHQLYILSPWLNSFPKITFLLIQIPINMENIIFINNLLTLATKPVSQHTFLFIHYFGISFCLDQFFSRRYLRATHHLK